MTCPACGIENPPSAQYCDCGYEFVAGSKPKNANPTQASGASCPKCKSVNPDSNAKFCPSCRGSMKASSSPVLVGCGCLGLIGAVVVIGLFSGGGDKSTRPSSSTATPLSSTPSASTVPALPTPETKPEPGSQWSYSSDEDKMGRKRSFAFLTSTNTLSFDFPYQGSQHGTLTIRKSAEWGTNVLVRIERGQFLCQLDDCTVNVRFDVGRIQEFSASGPTDHSTTVLFLENEARFVSQLRKAKVVRVEATFYQHGSQTLEFNVEGFKWP